MGIHDRDYYRDSAGGMFDAWGRWSVAVWLILVGCVVFFAQMVSRDMAGPGPGRYPVEEFAAYDFGRVLAGEVWRLITPLFLNVNLIALACNMLTVYWAGSRLEDRYGGREFLLFFLGSGTAAYAAYFLTQLAGLLPPGAALGPSPAIIAILVVFACHYPREQILLVVIPIPAWLLVVCYVGFAVLAAGVGNRVPFSAYLAGALFGYLYYRFDIRLASWLPGLPSRSAGRTIPKLRIVPAVEGDTDEPEQPVAAAVDSPPRSGQAGDESFESRVDAVLEKVSKYGQESLSPEEREILFRASEVYKKRRK